MCENRLHKTGAVSLASRIAGVVAVVSFSAPICSIAQETSRASAASLGSPPLKNEYLHVDEAFKLQLLAKSINQISGEFKIADGHYLYRHKVRLSVVGGAQPVHLTLPPGESKTDAFFGTRQVFRGTASFTGEVLPQKGAIRVMASYQGCADQGICYPPVTKSFSIDMPKRPAHSSWISRITWQWFGLFAAFLAFVSWKRFGRKAQ